MSDLVTPASEVIHPAVEILPPDYGEHDSGNNRSGVWMTVNANGQTRRITIKKPGPILSILILIAFGAAATLSVVVAVGLFAIFLGIGAVAVASLVVFGFFRNALARFRPR